MPVVFEIDEYLRGARIRPGLANVILPRLLPCFHRIVPDIGVLPGSLDFRVA